MKETSLGCLSKILLGRVLSRKLSFHVRLKMKSVLKIMKQPLRAVNQKTAVHTINNKIRKILEKHP